MRLSINPRLFVKTLLLVPASVLLFSMTASALTQGPLNCTPFPLTFNNGNGAGSVACPPFSGPAGSTLTGVTLNYISDYLLGSAGMNTLQQTFTPVGPGTVTFTPPTVTTTTTGTISSGAAGMGTSSANAPFTVADFSVPFNVNITSTVTTGTVTASASSVMVTYTYNAPVLPPGICSASNPVFMVGASPEAFQVRYFSNLNVGDSFLNITNTGAASTVAFPTQNGLLNVNVYTFSPDEQLISCCCCPVTPDGLASLSVRNDLISNTLTPGVPTSVVTKLVATDSRGNLIPGLAAYGATLHAAPATGVFGITETPFTKATLSQAELARITTLCSFIQANGSGFGVCKACRFGGLGAANSTF